MPTNTFATWLLVLSVTLFAIDARNAMKNQKRLDKHFPETLIPRRLDQTSERLKREFNPQTSPLNTVRSALQWRPNSQQPQGQVYK